MAPLHTAAPADTFAPDVKQVRGPSKLSPYPRRLFDGERTRCTNLSTRYRETIKGALPSMLRPT